MYKFKNQEQEDKFNKDFDSLIADFSNQPQKNKKRAIGCTLKVFNQQKEDSRYIDSQFFLTENMNYSEYMNYNYLQYIHKAELYEFSEYEISIFNPKKQK